MGLSLSIFFLQSQVLDEIRDRGPRTSETKKGVLTFAFVAWVVDVVPIALSYHTDPSRRTWCAPEPWHAHATPGKKCMLLHVMAR